MPDILAHLRKSNTFHLDAIRQNLDIRRDRDYFRPSGIQVFFGEQGSGKTLTAKLFTDSILRTYSKALLVSNVGIKDRTALSFDSDVTRLLSILSSDKLDTTKHFIQFTGVDELEMILRYVKRDKYGVVIFADEFQNYFSNQESKNVPSWVIEQSAQNRKQRRVVIATSQDYDQLAKPIRRRTDLAFKCSTISIPIISAGPILTIIKAYDSKSLDWENGKMTGKKLKMGWYFHSKKLRDSFDTLQVIFTGKEGIDIFSQQAMKIQSELTLKMKKK